MCVLFYQIWRYVVANGINYTYAQFHLSHVELITVRMLFQCAYI